MILSFQKIKTISLARWDAVIFFDCVDRHYQLCHKSLTRGSSCNESSEWIASIASLHYIEINNDLERISNIEPFVDQYNWKN